MPTPEHSLLDQIVDLATVILGSCDAASITVVSGGDRRTVAATDDVALALDDAQYECGDGPCVRAASDNSPVRIDTIVGDSRWPEFTERAVAHGVAASLSLPLQVDAGTGGALNLYARRGPFGEHDEMLGELLAVQAGVAVRLSAAYENITELAGQLEQALESRDVIGQAKGIIAMRDGCSPEDAFSVLRRRSQHENRKLRDVAGDIVAEVTASAGAATQNVG